MKSFENFKSFLPENFLDDAIRDIDKKIREILEEDPIEDAVARLYFHEDSITVSLIFRILEQYHNWLHNLND